MSKGKGRKRHGEDHGEEHPDERWMASYMDMVTVLMCMFIVLYAMSSVDQQKFEQLRASLATGFGVVEAGNIDTAEGTVVRPEEVNAQGEAFAGGAALAQLEVEAPPEEPDAAEVPPETPAPTPAASEGDAEKSDRERAEEEVENLRALQEKIDVSLKDQSLNSAVRYVIDERGLTIRLVSSETFFLPDSAQLTEQTRRILDSVGPVLAPIPNALGVEGHTARLPASVPRPLDWELSTDRAVQVVRYLIDNGKVQAPRLSAIGYGESRPIAEGTTEADLELNRRVDIVVHSGQPESVRALIPEIAAGN